MPYTRQHHDGAPRHRAPNGPALTWGSETYETKTEAQRAIAHFIENDLEAVGGVSDAAGGGYLIVVRVELVRVTGVGGTAS